MKIAYLVNEYPKTTHSFIRREIAALVRNGIAVERFSIRRPAPNLSDPADREECRRTHVILDLGLLRLVGGAAGVAITRPVRFVTALVCAIRMGIRSDRGVVRHLAYLVEACVVMRWCERDGVDHLHAHFGTNPAAVALLAHLLSGLTYSFTVHGPEEFERAHGLNLAEKIAASTFVVAISEWGRAQLETWHGDAGPPIHVVRCGVDDDFLEAPSHPIPAAMRLVSVGRLCEQKAPLALLDAVRRVVDSGAAVEVVLVGDGPLRAPLEARIATLGLSRHVTLAGWLDGASVREQILASRALVLASVAEGLPVVLMEAMALGRPVVATSVAGVPELVDESCGWLIPPGDIEALSVALRRVLEADPERLAAMGQAGAQRVRARHDVAREAAELARLFRGEESR